MGLLDNIKDQISRVSGGFRQPEYEEYEDEGYYDEPEVEDVSGVKVVPRHGGAVQGSRYRNGISAKPAPHRGAYSTPSMFSRSKDAEIDPSQYYIDDAAPEIIGARTPVSDAVVQPRHEQVSKEPVFLLKPSSYDDVEVVVKELKVGRPVALVLKGVKLEVARRILDFCYGYMTGSQGRVEDHLQDRLFILVPKGRALTQEDRDKIMSAGLLKRSRR